jgi:hypothetical protein
MELHSVFFDVGNELLNTDEILTSKKVHNKYCHVYQWLKMGSDLKVSKSKGILETGNGGP